MTDYVKEHAEFVKKYKTRHNASKDFGEMQYQLDMMNPRIVAAKSKDHVMNNLMPNDLTDLVPPLHVNKSQDKFLQFLFGETNTKQLLDNRDKIYLGQLNDQCPGFNDPTLTQPYWNFATQKMECRKPMPNRNISTDVICANGPNPFAIEKYVREDGTAVCRVPVVRGKFFCNELSTNARDDHRGEHIVLPDGTGICAAAPMDPEPPKPSVYHSHPMYSRFFSDRVVHSPHGVVPGDIVASQYYNLFSSLRFNNMYIDTLMKVIRETRKHGGGKQKIVEYIRAMKDPMGAAFQQAIDALYEDKLPDALYRFHRDLYFYVKKYYPDYFKKGAVPHEDVMYFLGYEGKWAFDRSMHVKH